jgi:hypothetical protein
MGKRLLINSIPLKEPSLLVHKLASGGFCRRLLQALSRGLIKWLSLFSIDPPTILQSPSMRRKKHESFPALSQVWLHDIVIKSPLIFIIERTGAFVEWKMKVAPVVNSLHNTSFITYETCRNLNNNTPASKLWTDPGLIKQNIYERCIRAHETLWPLFEFSW